MMIEWTDYRLPRYISADNQAIDCILTITGAGDVPFTARANDVEQHGQDIYAAIVANADTIPIAPFIAPQPPPPPTVQQKAAALLAGNPTVEVVSATLPALNGTYSAAASSRSNITGIAVAINGGLGLPSGADTFSYPDNTGTAHEWPADKFIILAQGIMTYIYNLSQVAGGNGDVLPDSGIELDPVVPPPSVQQQAVTLLESPTVTVVCASVPALNGIYLADTAHRSDITGVAVAINGGLGLPSGNSTFNYPDATGLAHAWPEAQFLAFARGVMVYVYNLSQVAGGSGTALPDSKITLA